MKNKILIPTILFIFVVIISFFVLGNNKGGEDQKNLADTENNKETESQIILFYGDGCPHCVIVDEYIAENKVEDKVSFAHKEVYYNQKNAKELAEKAKFCGFAGNSIGVPFLFTGDECLVGDKDIINFFAQKIN